METQEECQVCRSMDPVIVHNIPHRGVLSLLCTPCVLRHHPGDFCPICFDVYKHTTTDNHIMCHRCPAFAHLTCLPSSSTFSYLCPHCSDPPTSNCTSTAVYSPKQLLCAAKVAALCMHRAAAMARAVAEQKVRGAIVARQKAKGATETAVQMVPNQQMQDESEVDDG